MPPELAVIPQNAAAFLHVRPADLWTGASIGGGGVRKLFPAWATLIAQALGDDPADTEALSIIFPTAASLGGIAPELRDRDGESGENLVFVETMVKPFEKDNVLERLLGTGAVEKKAEGEGEGKGKGKGKTYFVSGPKANAFKKGAVYFVNDRTYVFTMVPEMMPGILEKAGQKGPLAGALELRGRTTNWCWAST